MELLKYTEVRVATVKPLQPNLRQMGRVPIVLLLKEIIQQELLDTTRKNQSKGNLLLLMMDRLVEVGKKPLRRFTDEPRRLEITLGVEALTEVPDLPQCNNNAWYIRPIKGKQCLLAGKESLVKAQTRQVQDLDRICRLKILNISKIINILTTVNILLKPQLLIIKLIQIFKLRDKEVITEAARPPRQQQHHNKMVPKTQIKFSFTNIKTTVQLSNPQLKLLQLLQLKAKDKWPHRRRRNYLRKH